MFDGILPLFVLILAGFVSVRTGYVAAGSMRPIGGFVLRIALPALIFNAVSTVPLSQALNPGFLGAYCAGSLVAFGFGLFAMRRGFSMGWSPAAIVALGMGLSNSGFMGYPVVLAVVGERAATLLAQCMLVENFIMIPLALALSDLTAPRGGEISGAAIEGGSAGPHPAETPHTRGRQATLRRIATGVLANPIVVSVLAAFLFNLSGLALPQLLAAPIALLAHVASPVALFVIGGTIASLPLAGVYRRVSVIVTGKLILHPLAVFAFLALAPGVDRTALVGGVLFAAVPMLSIYNILGQKVGLELLTATAQLVATVASFATLTAAVWLLTG